MSELSEASFGAATSPLPPANASASANLVSPSLFGPGTEADGATAFEVKFLLTETQASALVEAIAGKLALDPYADPALGNAYLTTSLYTDTPGFDVFYRTEGYNRDKFRVRRYGVGGPVFAERKTKNGEKVRKHRSKIDASEVVDFARPSLNGEWAGEWFHSQLLEKRLQPVCRVAYERVAFTGTSEGGVVRLTLDRNIRGVLASEWKLEAVGAVAPLFADRVVCEMKFRNAMPALFRGIVADLALTPQPVSKYRLFAQFAGLVPAPVRAESAGTADESRSSDA